MTFLKSEQQFSKIFVGIRVLHLAPFLALI